MTVVRNFSEKSVRAGDIIHQVTPLTACAIGAEAYARFADDAELLAVCVIDDENRPLGLLTRAGFALKMADRFGRALYEKRAVTHLIGRAPLLVDVATPLSVLNAQFVQSADGQLLDGFVGVEDGRYRGVATGLDILRATAAAADRTAKGLAAERARAKAIEAALLNLFRSADALAAEKRAALVRIGRGDSGVATPEPPPTRLADLVPRIERLFLEIRARDEALLAALDAAESASVAKSQFLANTSHELRTPLNAIIGYAELLAETSQDRGDQTGAQDAERIAGAGRHLLQLINDILDMSKIEAGKLQVNPHAFDLAGMIADTVSILRPQARANATKLALDLAPDIGPAFTDGLRVRQCLLNLMSNAVKFARGGAVVVRARAIAGGLARIEVIDTGIGMAPEELLRLFEPFMQSSASTAAKFGGTGLGLAITKRLAGMLGGDVSVTSAVGVGSCFVLTLPTHFEDAEATRAA